MGKFIDITGQKFNRLTVVSRAENNKYKNATWNCVCDCGKECVVVGNNLRNGDSKSCGCLKKEKAGSTFKDITGQKFGRWTVISRTENDKYNKTMWNCVCECGANKVIRGEGLKLGKTKSCGCIQAPHILVRIEKYIDKSSDRWIWIGNKDKDGYGIITYNKKQWFAHRLVYTLFIKEIPDGMCVCHLNDERLDVTPSNLICNTAMWNNNDKVNKSRQSRGETSGRTTLTYKDILKIRSSSLMGIELAKKYNLSNSTISRILRRESWNHV